MKIGVEHAACGETFNDAQFLNPQQNQRRPDVIKKLNRDEQNPERNFVLLTLSRKSNAVMSNKHLASKPGFFVVRLTLSLPLTRSFNLPVMSLAPPRFHCVNSEGFRELTQTPYKIALHIVSDGCRPL